MGDRRLSRRQVLAGGLAGAAAVGVGLAAAIGAGGAETVRRASSTAPAGSDLGAVEHVVFLMHENRSFDHYFGTMVGVHGFDDTADRGAFDPGLAGRSAARTLLPFHLEHGHPAGRVHLRPRRTAWAGRARVVERRGDGQLRLDPHLERLRRCHLGTLTPWATTEGADIPFYYALAQNFTICDNYFCSVLGPTHPNRLMQMTRGPSTPPARTGGPILVTNDSQSTFQLAPARGRPCPRSSTTSGIPWKVYNPYGRDCTDRAPRTSCSDARTCCMYFEQYQDPGTSELYRERLRLLRPQRGRRVAFTDGVGPTTSPPTWPQRHPARRCRGSSHPTATTSTHRRRRRWASGTRPAGAHHPVSNPEVWAKTVLFIMYDENDGFFDHVTAPDRARRHRRRVRDRRPAAAAMRRRRGPASASGCGCPCSWCRPSPPAGWVCSDIFDHTSQLRFLEARFGVTAPNISAWRRSVTGDLTSTLTSIATPVARMPKLPATSASTTAPPVGNECSGPQIAELNPTVPPFPVPTHQKIPVQNQR